MGIRGLTRFIAQCGKLVTYNEYSGQYIAVDAFHRIYKYCSMKNMSEHVYEYAYICAVTSCASHLAQFNVIPFFVFDGTALQYKIKNKESVEKSKQENTAHLKDTPIAEKYQKGFKISPKQIKECEEIIKYLGFPQVRAPHEADSQCAAMTMRQSVDRIGAIITDDTDALVFGASAILKMLSIKIVNILRDIFYNFCSKQVDTTIKYSIHDVLLILNMEKLEILLVHELDIHEKYSFAKIKQMSDKTTVQFALKIALNDVLECLKERSNIILRELNQSQITEFTKNDFINLCLVAGTDYSRRACTINIEQIFSLFVKCNFNVEKVLQNPQVATTLSVDELRTRMEVVYDYYMNASVIDPNSIDMRLYKPNRSELAKLLPKYGFNYGLVDRTVRLFESNFSKLASMVRA